MTDVPLLVTTEWLSANLDAPGIRVLDATFKLPGAPPTAEEEYRARHIPGAAFFDIDRIADETTDLPHMLPSPEVFQDVARRLGISSDTHVIVYDAPGLMSAGRAWWTFRVYGHDRVSVLDGGLKAWSAEGRPVTTEVPAPAPGNFTAGFRPNMLRDRAQMLANVDSKAEQVIDARPAGRFTGVDKEVRPGLRSGHIPNSLNVPFSLMTDPATGKLKSPEALRTVFEAAGLDLDKPIAATCGSGVTAAALAFGLATLGRTDVPVYDGAWSEWGRPGDTPVVTG